MPNILITGGSGMIGSYLTEMLLRRGYGVVHLERSDKPSKVKVLTWDIAAGKLDAGVLQGIDAVVHLAGAGIADRRWTHSRKKEILESRTKSTQLLFATLRNEKHAVKTFISASAIGYYGTSCNDSVITEDAKAGSDFLAHVTQRWENEAEKIGILGIRVVTVRTGIVLSKSGGALPKLVRPVKLYVGAPLASGEQYMSWIHIWDHCGIIIKAIEDSQMMGPFNSVAPTPVTNEFLTREIAAVVKRPIILPHVPSWALHLLLGEMASAVVTGCHVSSHKIQQAGYQFKFQNVTAALNDLLR